MKTLYLLRHGHAESKTKLPDSARNLDEEGREEVRITANKMLVMKILPQLMISSHANRALQTAQIAAQIIGYDPQYIRLERDIYYTDTETLIDVIRSQDDTFDRILITGHNPTITWLAQMLDSRYSDSMPTAGMLAFEIQSDSWNGFLQSAARLTGSIAPRSEN